MKIEWNKKYNTIAVYSFIVMALVAVFWKIIMNIGSVWSLLGTVVQILMPFVYGFSLAFLLNPVVKMMENYVFSRAFRKKPNPKLKRMFSMIAAYLLALLVIVVFSAIVVPQVIVGISSIALKVPGYISSLESLIRGMTEQIPYGELPKELVDSLSSTMGTVLAKAYQILEQALPMVLAYTSKITTSVLNVVVGIIISIYVLSGKEKFFAQSKKVLYALLPSNVVETTVDLAHSANRTFSGFISGKILDSLIIGILCFIGMTIFQMPSVMLVSLIVGITNVIPYFGPFIGAIPGALIVMIDDPIKALGFLLFIVVLQQFDGNILGPKILGDSTGLSAFWVMFSILLFGGLFGFIGMFIGVPVFSVIYSVIRTLIEGQLKKRSLPVETKAYASQEHPVEF